MAPDAPSLAGLRFAVLALGDTAYANFCATGRQFDERLTALGTQIGERFARHIATRRERLARAGDVLRLLSPKHTLERGYSVTTDAEGKLLRSAQEVAEGAVLVTELRDGKVTSVVGSQPPNKNGKRRKAGE